MIIFSIASQFKGVIVSREKTVPAIKTDMLHYLTDLQRAGKTGGASWPGLVAATVSGLEINNIWDSGAVMALLIIEPVNATLGSELLLDTSQVTKPLVLCGLFMTSVT